MNERVWDGEQAVIAGVNSGPRIHSLFVYPIEIEYTKSSLSFAVSRFQTFYGHLAPKQEMAQCEIKQILVDCE